MIKPISFKNGQGLTLRGVVHIPKKYDTAVVFLHGFPGSMEGTAKRMARSLEKLGYLTLRFSFGGSMPSDGRFEDKLMSKEVKEIKYAIDFLTKSYKFKKLVLMGISTGSIDAALYAHKDIRISKLVLLSGVGSLKDAARYDFSDEQIRDFWKKGFIVYPAKRHGKKWRHNGRKLKRAFYDEFFKLDVLGSLHKFKKPVLIVHGTEDTAVPVSKDPHELYEAANKPKKMVIIKGANHVFKKQKQFKQMLSQISRFI